MNTADTIVRFIGALGAASGATAGSLLLAPGSFVPQVAIVALVGVSAFCGAFVAFWRGDATP